MRGQPKKWMFIKEKKQKFNYEIIESKHLVLFSGSNMKILGYPGHDISTAEEHRCAIFISYFILRYL